MATFTGKVALVTGGTAGIGRATALAFAKEGAKVVVSGRNADAGAEVVKQIQRAGGEATFVRADVTKASDVQALIDKTLKTYSRLDIAFNNAGVEGDLGPLHEASEQTYDHIFNANVRGVFLSMKAQIPAMLKTGGGVIVNNSSIAGLIGLPGAALYVASKHAVIGLTKSAALEYSKQGVRVNAVAPASIQTDMFDRVAQQVTREALVAAHPIGRIGTPEEIAAGVLWLCSPGASFVTGHTLSIDGGFTAQ
jgi:NAD(P)-dependent dehydrogenase (short-subunit alcohol dehydrogenase family)